MGNYATKFLFVLTVTLSISCASSHKIDENALALSDKKASAETVELYLKLQENLERGIMLGHQDALAYGNNWFLDEGRSDVKSVCGDYPAVFGWDIGDIEKGNLANCDSIPFTTLANYVRKVEQWGGISVFTWHASNPVTGKTASDCSTQNAVKQVIENDSVQKKFLASLDKVAQFLGNLKDEAGEPIPVIFQPFHGHDSDTALWWSTTQCSASDFKNLWKLTINYLQNEKSVHNLYTPTRFTAMTRPTYCRHTTPATILWILSASTRTYYKATVAAGANLYKSSTRASLSLLNLLRTIKK